MVAACAFLIILAILFGVESVRSFIFGTLGVLGWIIVVVLGIGALGLFSDWVAKERKKDKEETATEKRQPETNSLVDNKEFQQLRKDNPEIAKKIWKKHLLTGIISAVLFAALCFCVWFLFGRG